MSVNESLEFDVSEALAGIAQIEAALTQAALSGADALSSAISSALDEVPPLEIADVDASAVSDAIDAAAASAEPTVIVEGDAGAITDAIDVAVSAADTLVDVTADASDVTTAIEEAVAAADTQVTPTVEPSGGGGGPSGGFAKAEAGIEGLEIGLRGLETVGAGAEGSLAGLGGALGAIGPAGVAAAASVGVVAEGTHKLVDAAIEAETAERRATLVLGQFRGAVESIHVGDLNTDLDSLARSLGEVPSRLLAASVGVFDFAKSSGLGGEAAAEFTNQVQGLAARIVARNPDIGSLAEVTERLSGALRSPRALMSQFGLSLDQVAVDARALSLGLVDAEGNVTRVGKAVASAQLLAEKFGGTLAEDVAAGSEFAATKLKKLKAQVTETFEKLGEPLIDPFIDALTAANPLIEEFGKFFSETGPILLLIAKATLPLLVGAMKLLNAALVPLVQLTDAANKLLAELGEHLGDLPIPTSEAGEAISEFVGIIAQQLIPLGGQLTFLNDEMNKNAEGTTIFGEAVGGLIPPLTNADGSLTEFGEAFGVISPEEIQGTADALKTFSDSVTSAADGVSAGLDKFKENQGLKTFVDNIAEEVGRTTQFVEAIKTLVDRGATTLASLLAQEGPEALRPAQQAAGLRDDLLKKREGQAETLVATNKTEIAKLAVLAPQLKSAVDDPLQAAIKAAADTAATSPKIGADLMAGIVRGIVAGSPAVGAATAKAVQDAIAAAYAAADAHSPARKMIPLGRSLPDGTKEGIREASPAMQREAEESTRKAMTSAAKGIDESDAPEESAKRKVKKIGDAAKKAATDTAKELADLGKRLADVQDTGSATSKALDQLGPVRLARLLAEFRAGTITLAEFNRLLKQTGLTADDMLDVISETRSEMQQFTDDAVSGLASLEDALNGVKENESLDDFLLRIRQNTVKTAQFLLDIQQLIKRGADDLAAAFLNAGIESAFAAHQTAGLSGAALNARERQFEKLQQNDARNQALATREAGQANRDGSPQNVNGQVVQNITVNEVSNDPNATAAAVSARQAQDANR